MRRWSVVPAMIVVLSVGACTGDGGDDSAAPTSGPPVIAPGEPGESARTLSPEEAKASAPKNAANDADVAFVEGMTVHHSQAVEMGALAEEAATKGSEVRKIASRIGKAQAVEIDAFNQWLERNGHEPLMVPGAKGHEPGQHEHGEHSGHDMAGMATPAQMKRLASLTGKKFDRLFLKLMITHHEGALIMSREVQKSGSDVVVQQLADEIISTQSAEIRLMRGMQQRLTS